MTVSVNTTYMLIVFCFIVVVCLLMSIGSKLNRLIKLVNKVTLDDRHYLYDYIRRLSPTWLPKSYRQERIGILRHGESESRDN